MDQAISNAGATPGRSRWGTRWARTGPASGMTMVGRAGVGGTWATVSAINSSANPGRKSPVITRVAAPGP